MQAAPESGRSLPTARRRIELRAWALLRLVAHRMLPLLTLRRLWPEGCNRQTPRARRLIDARFYRGATCASDGAASPPENVALPCGDLPAFSAYLTPAYALSLLMVRADVSPLLAGAYVSLYFPLQKLKGRSVRSASMLDHLALTDFEAFGLATFQEHADLLRPGEETRILATISSSLARGSYVYAHVNEFYLPGLPTHARRDARHPLLVTGWDNATQTYTAVTYVGGVYRRFSVAPAPLVRSIISRGSFFPASPLYYATAPRLTAITLVSGIVFSADAALLRAQLERYLSSLPAAPDCLARITGRRHGLLPLPPRPYPCHYGLRTYDSYAEYLSEIVARRTIPDMRTTRVLVEHKQLMLARLQYMERAGVLDPALQLSDAYRPLVGGARALHLATLAWRNTRLAKPDALQRAIERLASEKQREHAILSQALDRYRGL